MSRRRYKAVPLTSFIELSDDMDELLELHSQSLSLNVQAETELKLRRSEMDLIKAKLKKVRQSNSELLVTDHAVVRYLERVTGLDIEACKKEMLSKLPKDYQPSPEVELVDVEAKNLCYVIRDNLVISVTPASNPS